MKTDLLVIGAGPAGLHLAERAARAGIDVTIVDAQQFIGQRTLCAGVIGEEAFARFRLPTGSVLNRIHTFRAISPQGRTLEYRSPLPVARVVDKSRFNRDLATLARKAGATFLLGGSVELLEVDRHGIWARCQFRSTGPVKLRARAAVVATGVNTRLTQQLGLVRPCEFLRACQVELTLPGERDGASQPVEIYVGRCTAPGGFAWRIPLGQGRYRIGLMTNQAAAPYFTQLLKRLLPRLPATRLAPACKPIAQLPAGPTVSERVLVVGEAAGHVKTSTGGGIYYGLLSAEFAASVLVEAFRRGNFSSHLLGEYERYCRNCFSAELFMGYFARRLAAALPDRGWELAFARAETTGLLEQLNGKLQFDWHQQAIVAAVRNFFRFS
jgi:digeranylgeranylglycerophospholipid reductase